MYEKYMLLLEEEAKIRNLKNRSVLCYKNYVSYFLNYVGKDPQELSCQDVRDFLLAKKEEGLKATTLNLYNSAIRFFYRNVLHILWDDVRVPRMRIDHKLPTVLSRQDIDGLLDSTDDLKYRSCAAVSGKRGFRQAPLPTVSATALRPILWKQGLTPVRSRPCSDTGIRNLPKSTCM